MTTKEEKEQLVKMAQEIREHICALTDDLLLMNTIAIKLDQIVGQTTLREIEKDFIAAKAKKEKEEILKQLKIINEKILELSFERDNLRYDLRNFKKKE